MEDAEPDAATVFAQSVEEFQARVRAVVPEAWGRPTPCAEWDVRALVNHVVGEQRWVVPLMGGRTVAEVGDALDGDLLGSAPQETADAAAKEAVAALSEPGALERTVHLSFGDFSGADYAWQMAADHVVHSWDLAVAAGGDPDLDHELVTRMARWWEQWEDLYRGAGAVGSRVDVAADAPAQDSLLASFGRDPRWGS